MIPASYLFKDAFEKTWYEPDIEAAVQRHHRPSGLTRLAGLWSQLAARARRPATGRAVPAACIEA